MNWQIAFENIPQLLEGTWLTVQLVGISVLIGIVIAVPVALLRISRNPIIRSAPLVYTYFFRGTPILVQLFLFYYGLAQFDAVRESALWPYLREAYICALFVFSLNTGAYVAEILRGAILAVPAGEVEAAESIGMSRFKLYSRIILPRAARIVLPAYGNEVILMLKASALASTITLLDLTGMARTVIARTYMPVEIFFAAGCIYLILTFLLVQFFHFVEKRIMRFQNPVN